MFAPGPVRADDAERQRNPALLIVAHDALGDTSLRTGELRAARRHLERGVELALAERCPV